uniref:C2H2-type domain-containing protein n=1 Tax=Hucho hucho TaxID=62062 RepID=A0A4W5PHJ4_9TELE
MNDEQDRPYGCSTPGCSQRFQTEDHLMIHKHKHEMTLKFSSIKADPLAGDNNIYRQHREDISLVRVIIYILFKLRYATAST